MFDMSIFELEKRIGQYILVGQLGSKAYGTDTPESDDDFTGVAIAPMSHYIGLDHWENDGSLKIERKETHNAEMTAFELKKFLKLCIAFNPNAIPLLYLRPQDYELIHPFGELLIFARYHFTSKAAYRTMIGYAKGQRNMVLNQNTGKLGQKRKELVAKYGYDVKYASHTVRLLRMAVEFFKDGVFQVYREHDCAELLEIRQGKWSLGAWLGEVDLLLAEAEQAEKLSNLPDKPNYDAINSLCMNLIANGAAIK